MQDDHFQKKHDIQKLISLLPKQISIPEFLEESSILSEYAVNLRYPGDFEEISEFEV